MAANILSTYNDSECIRKLYHHPDCIYVDGIIAKQSRQFKNNLKLKWRIEMNTELNDRYFAYKEVCTECRPESKDDCDLCDHAKEMRAVRSEVEISTQLEHHSKVLKRL